MTLDEVRKSRFGTDEDEEAASDDDCDYEYPFL